MLSGRPYVEAAALLGSAGHRLAPPAPPSFSLWRTLMSQNVDFAFLDRIDAVARPHVVGGLDRLAQLIEDRRGDSPILLEEIENLHARRRMAAGDGPPAPTGLRDRGVQVWTQLPDGTRDRSLGFAWLRGGGREQLQMALTKVGLRKGLDPRLGTN